MNDMQNKLTKWLFETEAFKVSPGNSPFWYTSGKIGPFYINTHYLYGNASKAEALLNKIDLLKKDKVALTTMLVEELDKNYAEDAIFSGLINDMTSFISHKIDVEEIDYITGGERRDWFFSILCAKLLKKPHLTIFKDLSAVEGFRNDIKEVKNLNGAKCLHIADLITEASSYERAWIPAIKALNGIMPWTVVVVDRKQGGMDLLAKANVEAYAMVAVEESLFQMAKSLNYVDADQFKMLMSYSKNPDEAMKKFIEANPEFIKNAILTDDKSKTRAQLCVEKGFYR